MPTSRHPTARKSHRAPLLASACLCAGFLGLATLPARAADLPGTPPASAGDAGYEIDTENIFGFTEGSDTNDRGEQELSISAVGRFNRAAEDSDASSTYHAWEGELEYEYGFTRNLTIGVSASFANADISNIEDLDDTSGGGFNGLSAEIKYRLLSWEHSPVGLTLAIEPEWSRFDDDSGARVDGFGLPIRLLIDREIMSETLFGAINLAYEPEWAGSDKESGLEISGALSWQAAPGFFLGGELRYLAGFEGAGLDSFEGGALYLGPSLYTQLGKAAYFKAAYSYQIVGSASEGEGNLDLISHEKHQLLLKLGVEF
ncbi:hypothetical protein LGR54_05175 [Ancylobacter sp. Lp-2]|uniref:hypothetical protein n=1 Tax=Ancylobacter sp. Lp-2 TaxID=2881339 RepID=UPI001E64DC1D|nr:hypothetical protein [Ancylobacter sp. Lp-2]MCB4767988.1 hypothetical protein [Ancylobacter sp. Lp-2]